MEVHSIIAQALEQARKGVEEDTTGSRVVAVPAYQAVALLRACQSVVDKEHRDEVENLADRYAGRAACLEAKSREAREAAQYGRDRMRTTTPSHPLRMAPVTFQGIAFVGGMAEPKPKQALHVPYWLMRVLAHSMVEGIYVTPVFYVPSALWLQSGARVVAYQAKFENCVTLLDWVLKLKEEDLTEKTDPTRLQEELGQFCVQLDSIQNNLARSLSFIAQTASDEKAQTGKLKVTARLKKMGNALSLGASRLSAGSTKLEDDTVYIQMLVKIFENAQFLDTLLTQFEEGDQQSAESLLLLAHISEFFHRVLCAMVLHDFGSLLKRYMKKSLESFLD